MPKSFQVTTNGNRALEEFLINYYAEKTKVPRSFSSWATGSSVGQPRSLQFGHFRYGEVTYCSSDSFELDVSQLMTIPDALSYMDKLTATVAIQLTNDYTAVWQPGSDIVGVGCQDIPLAKVRELLAAIDKVNI